MARSPSSRVDRRIRQGGLALLASGLLQLTSPVLVVGTITPPAGGRVITETSARNATALGFRVGMALSILAFAALLVGLIGLYAHLARTDEERVALAGLVVTVVALVCYLPLLGVVTYVLPAVGVLVEGGNADALSVLDRTWTDPLIVLPFLGGLLENLGIALLGVAVWRAGTPSRYGGMVLVAAGVVGVPAFLDVVLVQYLSPIVVAAGLLLVGAGLWRSPAAE